MGEGASYSSCKANNYAAISNMDYEYAPKCAPGMRSLAHFERAFRGQFIASHEEIVASGTAPISTNRWMCKILHKLAE